MGNSASTDVDIDAWFSHVVGVKEPTFQKLSRDELKAFFFEDDAKRVWIRNKNVNFCCGRFEVSSLQSLLEKQSQKTESNRSAGPILRFLTRSDSAEESICAVDVCSLQALPENRNAVFQVASNMNAVEAIGEDVQVDSKNFTTDYVYDKTQGPAASVSAGPAAIQRVFCAFGLGERQTRQRQINFLEKLCPLHFTVNNGYVVLPVPSKELQQKKQEREFAEFPKPDSEEWENLKREVSVGVHSDCQVVWGRRIGRTLTAVSHSEQQLVHQVFVAAVNLGQGVSAIENRKDPQHQNKALFVLEAMYEGTYLAANALGAQKLYLTLVGGGVFHNSPENIVKAISGAHRKYGGQLKEVVVVMYSPTKLTDHLKSHLEESCAGFPWEFVCVEKGVPKKLT